mmetsp:Transcript_83477/g.186500  ORF Transcript_83477/g.186500 Transcript_83477/m.186500 type:complete len:617 (+) Transcript_83477:109-1959(+)
MPPKAIFKGQTFAISGKLSQPRKEYEELIRKYGGEVANSVTAAVTFLISNEEDVKACSQKVATAKGRSVPIVQEGFIGSCATAKRLLEPGFFAVKGAASKKRKAAAKEAPKAAAEVAAKKKPRLEASSAAAAAAGPVTTTEAIAVIAKSGLVGKAAVVQEEVSKGFVKGSLTWDVEMVLNDPSKGTDKYYIMQLLAAKAGGGEFWAVQHWGRTGLDGTVHVDGPFPDVILAKQIFRKKYRHKTGNVWGQIGTSFKEVAGKYKLIAKGSMSNTRGRWQYYLHNEVDGKTIGWYDYEAPAAKNMEKYWRQFESNDGLDIRLIQSDYFKYEVNFGEMIQKNTTSGMRRAIRRVAAGEEASTAPPAAIPEPALPVAAAAASDSGSSDEEVEEDEEEDEEEEGGEIEAEAVEAQEEGADEEAAAACSSRSALPVVAAAGRRAAPPVAEEEDEGGLTAPAGHRVAPPMAEEEDDAPAACTATATRAAPADPVALPARAAPTALAAPAAPAARAAPAAPAAPAAAAAPAALAAPAAASVARRAWPASLAPSSSSAATVVAPVPAAPEAAAAPVGDDASMLEPTLLYSAAAPAGDEEEKGISEAETVVMGDSLMAETLAFGDAS